MSTSLSIDMAEEANGAIPIMPFKAAEALELSKTQLINKEFIRFMNHTFEFIKDVAAGNVPDQQSRNSCELMSSPDNLLHKDAFRMSVIKCLREYGYVVEVDNVMVDHNDSRNRLSIYWKGDYLE